MEQDLSDQLAGAIVDVENAIAAHQAGQAAPYSLPFLRFIHDELTSMRDGWPAFPFRFGRAVADWDPTELGGKLLMVGQAYQRRRKRALGAPQRVVR